MVDKILVTGALGQIGSELVPKLKKIHGENNVISLDFRNDNSISNLEIVDAKDKNALKNVIKKYDINIIYHLVGILSAAGEKDPTYAWNVNMTSLKNILDLGVELNIKKIFWPSSIAVFGPNAKKDKTPQNSVLNPTTIYGVTKVSGELLCNYYYKKYKLDVRSLRYPGIISWKTEPNGGTTDYAVNIFYDALQKQNYKCFVSEETVLPMIYMDDAIKAAIDLMGAKREDLTIRTSYNITALSFSAGELATEIKKVIPNFKCTYKPDGRQEIANSWPDVIDDSIAKKDWKWKHEYDLTKITKEMITKLKEKFGGD